MCQLTGYRFDPKNGQAITESVKQKSTPLGDVRRPLRIVGYFRKYISNFSKRAAPLYQLSKKTDENNKSSKSSINWKQEHQESLDQLLLPLTEPPILAYPDYNLQFILHVDASSRDLGAMLLPYQENQLRIIVYGSQTLTLAEKKYHSSKLDFLAVKWAVCNHFCDYLYYAKRFEIHTITT